MRFERLFVVSNLQDLVAVSTDVDYRLKLLRVWEGADIVEVVRIENEFVIEPIYFGQYRLTIFRVTN